MFDALGMVQRIGGRELLDKIVSLFRSTSAERLEALQVAVASHDLRQVSRLAHAIKGSAAQVGAEPLRASAAALELECESLQGQELPARVALLEALTALAWEQLDEYTRGSGETR